MGNRNRLRMGRTRDLLAIKTKTMGFQGALNSDAPLTFASLLN